MTDQFDQHQIHAIQRRLVDWFLISARELPWRENPTPYRVLVSEIMLQQTQSATVIPYFQRFVERFPDIKTLADASEEEVLRYWSGLGYYRRGRQLHATARAIQEQFDGEVPASKDALKSLPGVGEYTLGAVLSIAFQQRMPVVDGNVTRVLSRLFAITDDVAAAATRSRLWQIAETLVPAHNPGTFNQALMELGALVCLPRQPQCERCCLQTLCLARKQGLTNKLPIKQRLSRSIAIVETVLVIQHRDCCLLINHNPQGLYRGMWQLPWRWQSPDKPEHHGSLCEITGELGVPSVAEHCEKFHQLVHQVTNHRIKSTFFLYRCPTETGLTISPSSTIRWVSWQDALEHPLPAYQKKGLRVLAGSAP